MMTLGDWAVVVALLAALWALQMYMAYLQARAFMLQVRRLRGVGRAAIGVSSTNRLRRRTYVALAEENGRVIDAVKISGLTVFARPRLAPALRGCPLDALVDDESGDLARAASVAAATLLSSEATDRPDRDDVDVEGVSAPAYELSQ